MNSPAPQPTTEPLRLTRHGLTIRKRHGRQDEKYTCRIRFRGSVHHVTLAQTAKESFPIAVTARKQIQAGRWSAFKASTALRLPAQSTLGQIDTAYRLFDGHDRPAATTRDQNLNALASIIRETLGAETNLATLPLERINADLAFRWKEIKRQLAAAADDDERTTQLLRSANSRFRQARSVFSDTEDLRRFYAHHAIVIPDTLAGFLKEPPFPSCAKDEYHAPDDTILANTFAALETLNTPVPPLQPFAAHVHAWHLVRHHEDLNMFKAIWLAIGFGLRRGEIAQLRNRNFVNVAGVIYCRGDVLAKNHKFPEVRCQLNAWDRLRPLIANAADQDAYVLEGTPTERCDTCYRRISEWMTRLGWQTTHHLHEWRAWSGCQIAMAPGGRGLLDAQVFMRHASYGTTEKFYGHHMKIRLDEVQLKLPIPVPAPTFQPTVVAVEATAPTV